MEKPRFSIQTQRLSELQCPVCSEYMQPPIMLCDGGHSICELCFELMTECPLCLLCYSGKRNSRLEALTATVEFPCKYCRVKYSVAELKHHSCPADVPTTACIIGQVYGDCSWSGLATDLAEHCERHHPLHYSTDTKICAVWRRDDLSNVGIQNVHLVECTDALFIIMQKYDSTRDVLHFNLCCECEQNRRYTYEIRVGNLYDAVLGRKQVENETSIATFLPSKNEITVPIDRVTDFFVEGNELHYMVAICDCSKTEGKLSSVFGSDKIRTDEDAAPVRVGCGQRSWDFAVYIYGCIKKQLRL